MNQYKNEEGMSPQMYQRARYAHTKSSQVHKYKKPKHLGTFPTLNTWSDCIFWAASLSHTITLGLFH